MQFSVTLGVVVSVTLCVVVSVMLCAVVNITLCVVVRVTLMRVVVSYLKIANVTKFTTELRVFGLEGEFTRPIHSKCTTYLNCVMEEIQF